MCPVSLIVSLEYLGILPVLTVPWWDPGLSRPVADSGPQFSHLVTGVVIPTLTGLGAQTLDSVSQLSTHGGVIVLRGLGWVEGWS